MLRRARELAGWLLRRRSWVRVQGQSMLPTLEPGDLVLTARRRARVGDLVVLPDPREPARVLVKRVGALQGAQIRVASDNPAGADSRTFGPVPASSLHGVVTLIWSTRGALRTP